MLPKANEIYRHFKGNLYKVITIAVHTETDEEMVVYQALYGNYMVYCRPLSMFCSKVDHSKYPDVQQEYRFEKVEAVVDAPASGMQSMDKLNVSLAQEEKEVSPVQKEADEEMPDFDDDEEEFEVDEDILAFLDAETVQERKNILAGLHDRITDDMIYTMAIALDVVIDEGDLEDKYRQLMSCLNTIEKYEIER